MNADIIKKVVYVERLRDKREFGPFKNTELVDAAEETQQIVEEDFEAKLCNFKPFMKISNVHSLVSFVSPSNMSLRWKCQSPATGAPYSASRLHSLSRVYSERLMMHA